MSEVAIRVEGLGKKFEIGHQVQGDFRSSMVNKFRNLFGQTSTTKEDFWALKDVSFDIKQGEAVGIIGRNGAGKSTLLKILSRITDPTSGRFEINGRVSSLLEVGTGFHQELTGRENIYLNGTILGMKRAEIKTRFDEIVAFSGVEKFIDTPVKHYSSGMKVRLAFSVAAHLEPEILIIDEVLAVGDAEFQKKCLGKMDEVSKKEGRTILFVSHNMGAIQNLCSSGIVLDFGSIGYKGTIDGAIQKYLNHSDNNMLLSERIDRKGGRDFRFLKCEILDEGERTVTELLSGNLYTFRIESCAIRSLNDVRIRLQFVDRFGNIRFLCNNAFSSGLLYLGEGLNTIHCEIPHFPLPRGSYHLRLTCATNDGFIDDIETALEISVVGGDFFGTGKEQVSTEGVLVKHSVYVLQ